MHTKISDRHVVWMVDFILVWFAITPFLKVTEIGQTVSRIAGLIVIFIAVNIVIKRGVSVRFSSLVLALLLFIVYCSVHIPFGEDFTANVATFIRIFGGCAILLAVLTVFDVKALLQIEDKIYFLGVLCAIYTLFQIILYSINSSFAISLLGIEQYWGAWGESIRPRGLMVSVGGSASLIATAMIIYFRKLRYLEVSRLETLGLYLCFFAIAANFTRTFVISIALFLLLYFFLTKQHKTLLVTLVCICTVSFLLILLFPERIAERLSDIPLFGNVVESGEFLQGRLLLSEQVWNEYILQNTFRQLWGNDLNFSTNIIMSGYKGFDVTIQSSTHNDIVWLLVNLGVIGALLYFSFLFTLLRSFSYSTGKIFFALYVVVFFFLTSLAGESINITGHRYIQMLYIGVMLAGVFRHSNGALVK